MGSGDEVRGDGSQESMKYGRVKFNSWCGKLWEEVSMDRRLRACKFAWWVVC